MRETEIVLPRHEKVLSLDEISEPKKSQEPTTPPRPKKPLTARQIKIMELAAKSQPKLGSGFIKMNPGLTKLQEMFENSNK